MKPKNLVPLIVILVILAGLVMLKKSKEETPSIAEQVGLVSLLPEGVSKGDMAKLEMYAGGKPDEKVVLVWDAEGDLWRIETHYNAPVKEDKIDEYLDAIAKLEGEFRAAAKSDEDLEAYDLTDEKAFHVLGYKKEAEEPAFHFLVGKAPDYKTVFVRDAASKEVYVEAKNLRQKAGLYGDDTDKAPEADTWLDKQVIDLDEDEITRVALTAPDKELVFEYQAKPVEKDEEEEEEGQEEKEGGEEIEPEAEYEWVLAKGGLGDKHKKTALDSLLRKLDSLSANDIVDPAKKADWGLESPTYRCVVSLKEQEEDVVIEGGRPEAGKDGYVRVAAKAEDIVYELSKYNFDPLWPKGSALFDLPKLDLDKDKLERIEVSQPEGNVVLVKKEDKWTVAEPAVDLEVLSTTLDTIARTLAKWKAEDYADSPDGCGLDAPTHTATFTITDVESHTIALGADARHIEGFYARLDDETAVLAMSKTDRDKIFKAPNDLYDRSLFEFDDDDIKAIRLEREGETYEIQRKDDAWDLTVGGATVEADSAACDALVTRIADLEAKEIVFGKTALEGELEATITVTRDGDEVDTILIAPKKDGACPMVIQGKGQLFTLSAPDTNAILLAADALKKPEPEPEEEDEAAEAKAEEAPAEQPAEDIEAKPGEVPAEEPAKAPEVEPQEQPAESAQPGPEG